MDDIQLMQYKNLRAGFNLLVDTILGKDYYNECMDVYSCDLECCADIIYAYNHKKFRKVINPFTNEKCSEIIDNSIETVKKQNKVEVIKKGKDKEYTITCPRCHSDLQFHLSDTYMEADKIPLMTGGYSNMIPTRHVCCPVCSKSISTDMLY